MRTFNEYIEGWQDKKARGLLSRAGVELQKYSDDGGWGKNSLSAEIEEFLSNPNQEKTKELLTRAAAELDERIKDGGWGDKDPLASEIEEFLKPKVSQSFQAQMDKLLNVPEE